VHVDANNSDALHKTQNILHDVPEEDSLFAAQSCHLLEIIRGHERLHSHIQPTHMHRHTGTENDIRSFWVGIDIELSRWSGIARGC
jgi:hypothetical protein